MADASSIEMSPEQEAETLENMQNIVGGAISAVSSFFGGGQEAEPEAAADPAADEVPTAPAEKIEISYNRDDSGALIVPDIDPNATGMSENQRLALSEGVGGMAALGSLFGQDVPDFARDGLGYSSGQIDMLDDLARRYDGIELDSLQGTLVALADDDALRDNVMDALMENDQELAHFAVQAFEQDPSLLAQFEDMVRNDPEAVQAMLPELQDNPDTFAEQVRNRGRDADTALAANQEVARQAEENTQNFLQDFLSGDMKFADILGPQIGGWLDSALGPFMNIISGLMGKAGEFLGQNLPEDSPARELAAEYGLELTDAANPEGAEPQGPKSEPRNENDPNRDVPATPNPHTM